MRILLTGTTGFIGSQLLRELQAADHTVTSVVRAARADMRRAVVADLRDADLRPHAEGCDFIVHAASVTSGSPEDLWAGNALVARRAATAAAACGAKLLYLSTTGVYGKSFGHFDDPKLMPRFPASPLSVARAAAEDSVLDVGGTVIRPHLVYGPGDRWAVSQLAAFMLAEDAWLGGTDVTVAAISVNRLAQGTVALLDRPTLPAALNAADPQPQPIADLVRPYFVAANRDLPTRVLSIDDAMMRLGRLGVSRNAVSMLGRSSHMNADAFWGEGQPATGTVSAARPR